MPGGLDDRVQLPEQRAVAGRHDRPVQGQVPVLELVVAGRPVPAGQAAVHLPEVAGRRPGHDERHRQRLQQPPDRHHVGRREAGRGLAGQAGRRAGRAGRARRRRHGRRAGAASGRSSGAGRIALGPGRAAGRCPGRPHGRCAPAPPARPARAGSRSGSRPCPPRACARWAAGNPAPGRPAPTRPGSARPAGSSDRPASESWPLLRSASRRSPQCCPARGRTCRPAAPGNQSYQSIPYRDWLG